MEKKSKRIFYVTLIAATLLFSSLGLIIPAYAPTPAPDIVGPSGKILHFELYITDGYINPTAGVVTPAGVADPSNIAGWPAPVYVWSFTDVDPGGPLTAPGYLNLQVSPPASAAPKGSKVGNAKFPAPFIEVSAGDDVYITVHNRGFYQTNQKVQDEHTLHLHGIHAQAQYDGFPESAGSYTENLKMFWRAPTYGGADAARNNLVAAGDPLATLAKDIWWNGLSKWEQQTWLTNNAGSIPTKANYLSAGGGIPSQFDKIAFPAGTTAQIIEDGSQYTYYFRAEHPGTYMYHCHVTASEHVQMGMYGAIVIRPTDYNPADLGLPLSTTVPGVGGTYASGAYYNDVNSNGKVDLNDIRLKPVPVQLPGTTTVITLPVETVQIHKTVYGVGTGTDYDVEYTYIESEFDTIWHSTIEKGGPRAFYAPNWKPQLWFVNGRTFPKTLSSFSYNTLEPRYMGPGLPNGLAWYRPEPRYNTFVKCTTGQYILQRYINMGYEEHPMHQHGWHMRIVGTDGMPLSSPYDKFTILIGSGETYDTITYANPVYSVNIDSGSPMSVPPTGTSIPWRQIFPVHDHNDYKVTTNGIYPGGALVLIEATDARAGAPQGTWFNPYTLLIEPLPLP